MPDQPANLDDDAPPSCLVLHGLGGGPYELGPLLEALERVGCQVSAPILPGHSVTSRVMPASNWHDWISTAQASFDDLAASGRPVVVVGFSTGATLALLLATRRPVARLVLLAPFLAIRHSGLIPIDPSVYLRLIAWFLPDLPRRHPPVRDPEARRQLGTVARFETFSLRATLSALDLIEQVKPLVTEIRTPTLILQGRLDSVVDPAGALWLAGHLGSSCKDLVYFSDSDHLLALDYDHDRVIATSVAFTLSRDEQARPYSVDAP